MNECLLIDSQRITLLLLGSSIGLSAEVGRGRATVEVAAQDGLDEGVEDDLGTAGGKLDGGVNLRPEHYLLGLGKGHPQNKSQLEDIVEG